MAIAAQVPARREVKRVLRELGLSDRQVRALLERGWSGLVGESNARIAELEESIAKLGASISTQREVE